MKRKYQEHEQYTANIGKVGCCSKKLTVSKQDDDSKNTTDDKKKRLPAIICFQRNKSLQHIITIAVSCGKNTDNPNERKDKPEPDQGPVRAFSKRCIALVHGAWFVLVSF